MLRSSAPGPTGASPTLGEAHEGAARVVRFRHLTRGENRAMTTPDPSPHSEDENLSSTQDVAGRRGTDDRRQPVDPATNPAPSSPEPDQEAVRKIEVTLDRVK